MVKCLMLDVDGVLVGGRRWDHFLFADLGIAPDELKRGFFDREWDDVIVGRKDLKSALAKSLKRMSSSVTPEALIRYWFANDSHVIDAVLLDVRRARQQGLFIYLATNQEHERASYLMDTVGLETEVEGIAYSAQVGFCKPQAGFYTYAATLSGFEPHELLLVDDTPANIEGARKAGWHAAHWDGQETLSQILQRNMLQDDRTPR